MADGEDTLFHVAAFMCGLFVLERGADKFVDSSAIVSSHLGVSPTLIGLLTCGAEWEELVVIVVALGQQQNSLAMGNLMGSSIANILGSFSLGLLFARADMAFDRSSQIYTAISVGVTSAFLLILYVVPPGLQQVAGFGLVVAFVAYVISVTSLIYKGALVAPEADDDSDSDSGADSGQGMSRLRMQRSSTSGVAGKHVRQLLLGLLMLVMSGYVIARSASAIGDQVGLSSSATGMTILSLATTLPEKLVAVVAGSRYQPEILVSNTVGSNMFLMTLCGGVVFLWAGNEAVRDLRVAEAAMMWVSAGALLLVVVTGTKRWMGPAFMAAYVLFLVLEVLNGRDD